MENLSPKSSRWCKKVTTKKTSEIYNGENAQDQFEYELEQALEAQYKYIVIEPTRIGDGHAGSLWATAVCACACVYVYVYIYIHKYIHIYIAFYRVRLRIMYRKSLQEKREHRN